MEIKRIIGNDLKLWENAYLKFKINRKKENEVIKCGLFKIQKIFPEEEEDIVAIRQWLEQIKGYIDNKTADPRPELQLQGGVRQLSIITIKYISNETTLKVMFIAYLRRRRTTSSSCT
jgi:hypothetical protein